MSLRPPELFSRGPAPLARLFFYCALALACIVVDAHYHQLEVFRKALNILLAPFQTLANSPGQALQAISRAWDNQSDLQTENQLLRKQLLEQAPQIQQFQSLQVDLKTLNQLLQIQQRQFPAGIIAPITGVAHNPFTQKIIIGAGSNKGLEPGSPVLSQEGLVGQVTAVNLFSSEVSLITNKNVVIPLQLARTGLRTLAFGNGEQGTLSLPYVPVGTDIRTGDVLVTSGIDGLYPEGLTVATVLSVQRDNVSAFAQIRCQPDGAVFKHRQVLVLNHQQTLNPDQTDLEQPDQTPVSHSRTVHKGHKP